jgi:hypothetical protein
VNVETFNSSPIKGKDSKPIPSNSDTFIWSRKMYGRSAKEATENLVKFLSDVLPAKRVSVVYFDEVHKLDLHFSIFLRLVQHQLSSTKMWYAFMGTKSSISYYALRPSKRQSPASLACTCLTEEIVLSLELKAELTRLLPPYIDIGFDQRAIAMGREVVSVSSFSADMEVQCTYISLVNHSCSFRYQRRANSARYGQKRGSGLDTDGIRKRHFPAVLHSWFGTLGGVRGSRMEVAR